MAVKADQVGAQITAFVQGLTWRQKLTIVGGAAAVAAVVWIFVALLGRADYRTLYSGLSPTDAQALARRLSEKNILCRISTDGSSIQVPADELDKARLEVAAGGAPQSGRLGFELFDKPNWAGSDFAEKVNYQRALEGELERTIQSLAEVEAARVHLVMPQESLFTDQDRQAKASVVIRLRSGHLSDDAQEAITNLVASAVENLKPENVTLINADGGVPILARGGRANNRPRYWTEFETALAQKVVATLEPVVGPGKTRANITVEYDLATSDSTQETYDPNGSVVLTSQLSDEQAGATDMEGPPGTASNVPGKQPAPPPKPTTASDSDSQRSHSESKSFAVSKTVRHILQPAGNLKRIAAAVLVDDAIETKEEKGKTVETRRKRTPEEMKQISGLVAAAIDIDPNRGDKLDVENLSFLGFPSEKVPAPGLPERLAPLVEKWISVVRYGALFLLFLLVYLLVLRPVRRQLVLTFRELPHQIGLGKSSPHALTDGAKPEALASAEPSLGELEESPVEAKQASMLKKNLLEKVRKEPGTASRLIQNWMRQGDRQ